MTDAIATTSKKLTATQSLQLKVDEEIEMREILTKFIKHHMVKGIDFGAIMIGGRPSKDCLFKPGAEKIGSLLRLRPEVVKDNDTWEMAGSKPGLFCYRCNLYNQKNELVGMGLGACDVTEKKSFNNAIKIGKKRAFVDAILATGALSDFFTQDLEDDTDTPVTSSKPQEALSGEYLAMIDQSQDIDALITACKAIKTKIRPELQKTLREEYTRRKREIETDSMVEDADRALGGKK